MDEQTPAPPENPPKADAKKQPIEALAKEHAVPDWLLAAIKAGKKLEDGHLLTLEELDRLADEVGNAKVRGT